MYYVYTFIMYTLRRSWVHNKYKSMALAGNVDYKLIVRKCRWLGDQMAVVYSMQNADEMDNLFQCFEPKKGNETPAL